MSTHNFWPSNLTRVDFSLAFRSEGIGKYRFMYKHDQYSIIWANKNKQKNQPNKPWKKPWITVIRRINLVNPYYEIQDTERYFQGHIKSSLINMGKGWVRKSRNEGMHQCIFPFMYAHVGMFLQTEKYVQIYGQG